MTHYPNSCCEKHLCVTTSEPICPVCLIEKINVQEAEIERLTKDAAELRLNMADDRGLFLDKWYKLEQENKQLRLALEDALQLIYEHPILRAHATRVSKIINWNKREL